MAAGDDRNLSSPFDAMLNRDRDRLDRLYGDPARAPERPAPPAPIRPPRAVTAPKPDVTETAAASSRDISGTADGIQFSIRLDDESEPPER